jgi:hypothetical protein
MGSQKGILVSSRQDRAGTNLINLNRSKEVLLGRKQIYY